MATDLTERGRGPAIAPADLQALAQRHLWMHFTRMGAYSDEPQVPIIARGEGCYVCDDHGQALPRRPLGAVLRQRRPRPRGARRGGRRAGARARVLPELGVRPSAGDRARRADRHARPGDLNRVFFTSGGVARPWSRR